MSTIEYRQTDMSSPTNHITYSVSDGFADWMSQSGGSVAISTYQAGKVVLLGWDGCQVTVHDHDFPRPMGLAVSGHRLAVACRHEVVELGRVSRHMSHDTRHPTPDTSTYVPTAVHVTGDMNIHDVAYGKDGLWMVNTAFSCVSMSDGSSFERRWQPQFISQLVPEDRCHLNGLALADGRPKFVSSHGRTDEAGAWRYEKDKSGVLIDVDTGELVLHGLCMPHSPRRYEDHWWLLNSGMGELCSVDPDRGERDLVCTLPGYARGLCFVGGCAIIGLSKIRSSHVFDGVPVQDRFDRLHCAVAVVELKTGRNVGMFLFTSGCDELYDVQFLAGVLQASITNHQDVDCHTNTLS